MKKVHILFLLLFCSPFPAHSESNVSVNSLNYPVWAERDQSVIALSVGDELENGDLIKTGENGRAWLSMTDGSVIKLGQNTQFQINKASYVENDQGTVLDVALKVLKGAFRFTTGFFNPERRTPHQVNVQIGAITAGIRGTDIWGRSTESEDFVTLLDGAINVVADDEVPTRIDQPLALYSKKAGMPAEMSTISAPLSGILAMETELSKAEGIASIEGQYDLMLMSLMDGAIALDNMNRFKQAGYGVKKQFITVGEQRFTRLFLPGFSTMEAAQNQSIMLVDRFGIDSFWIKKNNPYLN